MQPTTHRVEVLLRRVAATGGIESISVHALALWQDVAGALVPIIGERGMFALYQRALHLAAARHPWLQGEGASEAAGFSALSRSIAGESPDDAIASLATLFETFERLLVVLIGASLSERLLEPIWDIPTRKDSAP